MKNTGSGSPPPQTSLPALGLIIALLPGAGPVAAQDAELDALQLADTAPTEVQAPSDWRRFVEAGLGASHLRSSGDTRSTRRLSLDIQYDHALNHDWRVLVADRLDLGQPALRGREHAINTLKEAYLSGRLQPDTLVDLGRINVRNGVALGYNPTDYFRAGAVRAAVSISPASLKENRQGSVMLRGQQLWAGGALSALFSPGLARQAEPEGLNPDLGATNRQHRGLLALSQKVGGFTPQLLVYQEESLPTQFGFNLTGLVTDATVAYLESSAGRSPSQLSQSLPAFAPCRCSAWHNRLSAGLTHTTAHKLSLSAEYHHNGGGLDADDWRQLRQGPPAVYAAYRQWAATAQEMPTRRAVFLHGVWQDALIPRLDLSAMHTLDLTDRSQRSWLEARYHQGSVDYAVQWQAHSGRPTSVFGALPDKHGWQLSLRYYF
ncbi:MAG: hypothetical protein L6Q67_06075 [Zoogloea sp.]|nr:hypothetical protein [Zoogloea sp.]